MNTVNLAGTYVDEKSARRRAIVATVLGNGFEWFDFMVYGFFAITIAKLFFPTGNDLTSLMLSVATFGVGFLVRPFGGILIGIYCRPGWSQGCIVADHSVDVRRHCNHRACSDLLADWRRRALPDCRCPSVAGFLGRR